MQLYSRDSAQLVSDWQDEKHRGVFGGIYCSLKVEVLELDLFDAEYSDKKVRELGRLKD